MEHVEQTEQLYQDDQEQEQWLRKLGRVDQAINQIAFLGRVIDEEKDKLKSDPPKPKADDQFSPFPVVLVQIGGEAETDSIRLWLPWLSLKAGADCHWWQPQCGEQVMIIAPNGNWSHAVIIGSLYRQGALGFQEQDHNKPLYKVDQAFIDKYGQTQTTWYRDGSEVSHDPIKHCYALSVKDKRETQQAQAEFKVALAKGEPSCPYADLILYEKDKPVTQLNLAGEKSGRVKLMAGKSAEKACEVLVEGGGDDKPHILLKTEKASIRLDAEGLFEVKSNEASIQLNKAGQLQIKCKKMNITSDDALSVHSKKIQIEATQKLSMKSSAIHIEGNTQLKGKFDVIA